ncbi:MULTISPECIES: hypothetical protein [unclassified Shewanella]|uniref:hypothetical protein n=1 Tax=unclassified Shewanella TaxID=196818 RepID=UPI001BBDC737|nr:MULTISPECIES: hypothetical protein [unclassified Shewanella]GIU20758.1 hypothetical protein TUM4444_39450 [Shewanella sp. MBTL60-112-B1]GIU29973.1 hypothetical protein TUM4445_12820 [Shewanella sp. MBTL60-112-B2]
MFIKACPTFKVSILSSLIIISSLTACSDDDDPIEIEPETPAITPPTTSTPTPKSGVFLDSPVEGIGYKTETLSGVTDAEGKYSYAEGETVTFFIGDLEFPATEAQGIVTPLNIANTEDVTNSAVINMARLLQTLDQDGDPNNGITITQTAIDTAEPVDFNLPPAEFAANDAVKATIENGGQNTATSELITEEAALAHLAEQLTENQIQLGIVGSWSITNSETDLLSITFFNNGTYVLFEVEDAGSLVDAGMEWGTYERDYETNRVYAGQDFDENGDIGLNDFGKETGDPQLFAAIIDGQLNLEVDEDADGTVDETLIFEAIPTSAELGPWLIRDIDGEPDENDLLMLVFYADGTYVHAEVDYSDQDEDSGMEWGSYSVNSDTNKLTIEITFDANGDTGLTDFTQDPSLGLFLSVTDDVLTLSVDEDADNEVDEIMSFTRP